MAPDDCVAFLRLGRIMLKIVNVILMVGIVPPAQLSADVIYDSLCVTDRRLYSNGIGNYCGGEDVLGDMYDVQAADSFSVTVSIFVSTVTTDSLTILGATPRKLCVGFHEEDGANCIADQVPLYFEEAVSIKAVAFEDGVFGYKGVRTTAFLSSPPMLRTGTWFASLQPSSGDWGYVPVAYGSCGTPSYECELNYRDGSKSNPCCDGMGVYGFADWHCDFYGLKVPMRIEGIPAGDCLGGERVTAVCKPGGGERLGKIVVKVRGGQAGGTVAALLDPPDPRDIRIALDERGRGKGKFKDIALGEHRVFVCDSIVDVTCAP